MAAGVILNAASTGVGIISGIFSSSGPDAKKYAERQGQIAALSNLAAQGNVNAWQALGAIGQVVPIGAGGLTIPGIETYRGNWTSKDWGDAYDPLVRQAKASYQAFAGQFGLSGVAQTWAEGLTAVGIVGAGGAPVQTPATGGPGSVPAPTFTQQIAAYVAAMPVWVWVLLIVLAVLLLRMK